LAFLQDWGSLIFLRLVTAFPDRFAQVMLANGGMPTGMIPAEYTQSLREAYKSLPVVKVAELGERFRDTRFPLLAQILCRKPRFRNWTFDERGVSRAAVDWC
jgi:pimeloyl-ACP methyl ester carboxylesterase